MNGGFIIPFYGLVQSPFEYQDVSSDIPYGNRFTSSYRMILYYYQLVRLHGGSGDG